MLEQLELLLELQKIDTDLADLLRQSESLPERIEQLADEKRRIDAVREAAGAALEEARKEHRKRERDLEDATRKVNELKSKQIVIKTNQEYAALTHEIDFVKQEISEIEDSILKLLENIEKLSEDVRLASEEAARRTGEMDAQIREFEDRLGRLNDELAVRRDERLRVAMRVDEPLLKRYESILRSKGDMAVARIEDGACSGCYKSLPPQTVIEVKRATQFTECDGCGRILYWSREDEDG